MTDERLREIVEKAWDGHDAAVLDLWKHSEDFHEVALAVARAVAAEARREALEEASEAVRAFECRRDYTIADAQIEIAHAIRSLASQPDGARPGGTKEER
jgi:hypothetical protein